MEFITISETSVTTVVGSTPKPARLTEQPPLNAEGKQIHDKGAKWMFKCDLLETSQDDATSLTLHDQAHAGVSVVRDGEQRRTSYLSCITSRLEGFDYERLTKKWSRNNRRLTEAGHSSEQVRRKGLMHKRDGELMLAETCRPVKITMPGPMSAADSTTHEHYGDEAAIEMDVATALNEEARELNALCVATIQLNEPVFSRCKGMEHYGPRPLPRRRRRGADRGAYLYIYPMPRALIRSAIATLSFWKRSSIQISTSWRLKLRPRS